MEIDHVIFLVTDLDAADTWLREAHGLTSVPGGRHEGHGTANRIVPLGSTYLELMTVLDPVEAATSAMGRWARDRIESYPRPAAVCLRTDDAHTLAARLHTAPIAMSRTRPDGSTIWWRLVGASDLFSGVAPVFFIQWDDPTKHPGREAVVHQAEPTGGMSIVVSGDRDDLHRRLGDHRLRLTVEDGAVGVASVTIDAAGGPIALH